MSIAETDHHDLHQRAEISIAAVARSPSASRRLMDQVRDLIDQMKDISGYLGVPFQMTKDLLDRACDAYFVEL